jgi:hypothetical protein
MLKLIGKVTDFLPLLQEAHSFSDLFIFVYVALTAKLEGQAGGSQDGTC